MINNNLPEAGASKAKQDTEQRLFNVKAGAFLASVAGFSAMFGFGATLAAVKKQDPQFFSKGMIGATEMADSGALLALRALGWGSFYAITGTSLLCYGIWKLSGANNFQEFRSTVGNVLPNIQKNDPPQSRTEFSGLNDFLAYVSTEKFGNVNQQSESIDT